MLRSIRYGEADRVLHLYTRIAAGLARLQGRAAGQVAAGGAGSGLLVPVAAGAARGPWRALHGQPGRHGARPCGTRERRPSLERAVQACDAVLRLLDSGGANAPAYEPALPRARSPRRGRGRGRRRTRLPRQAAAGGGVRPELRGCGRLQRERASGRLLTNAGPGWSAPPAEAGSFPLSEEAHAFLVGALGRPLAEAPEVAGGRRTPGGPRAGRDPRAPRA